MAASASTDICFFVALTRPTIFVALHPIPMLGSHLNRREVDDVEHGGYYHRSQDVLLRLGFSADDVSHSRREGTPTRRLTSRRARLGALHPDLTNASRASASLLERIEVVVDGYGHRRSQTLSPVHSRD